MEEPSNSISRIAAIIHLIRNQIRNNKAIHACEKKQKGFKFPLKYYFERKKTGVDITSYNAFMAILNSNTHTKQVRSALGACSITLTRTGSDGKNNAFRMTVTPQTTFTKRGEIHADCS